MAKYARDPFAAPEVIDVDGTRVIEIGIVDDGRLYVRAEVERVIDTDTAVAILNAKDWRRAARILLAHTDPEEPNA